MHDSDCNETRFGNEHDGMFKLRKMSSANGRWNTSKGPWWLFKRSGLNSFERDSHMTDKL